jgi:hypothetical protein
MRPVVVSSFTHRSVIGFLICTRVEKAFTLDAPVSFAEARVVVADELRIRFPGMVLTVLVTNARRLSRVSEENTTAQLFRQGPLRGWEEHRTAPVTDFLSK